MMEWSLSLCFDTISPLIAAGGLAPDQIPGLGWLTNSIFHAVLVTIAVLLFTRMATRKMELIPGGKQNLVEYVIEFLYRQTEEVVGRTVAPKAFPLLATIFIFVLISNWSGLIPGVGTIGFAASEEYMRGPITIDEKAVFESKKPESKDKPEAEEKKSGSEAKDKDYVPAFRPLFRPPSADLNFTLALALVFMIVWLWITVKEVGVWGFILHIFGPKGGLSGFMKYPIILVFLFVGIIELASIASRPVSLSFRLFGNIYAGETLLASMMEMGKQFGLTGLPQWILSVLMPLPFYFLEILIGILQATVFSLLCAVYIKLSTTHDEDH